MKEKYQEKPIKLDVGNKRTGSSKLIGQVYVIQMNYKQVKNCLNSFILREQVMKYT